jgi:hypothetical protein
MELTAKYNRRSRIKFGIMALSSSCACSGKRISRFVVKNEQKNNNSRKSKYRALAVRWHAETIVWEKRVRGWMDSTVGSSFSGSGWKSWAKAEEQRLCSYSLVKDSSSMDVSASGGGSTASCSMMKPMASMGLTVVARWDEMTTSSSWEGWRRISSSVRSDLEKYNKNEESQKGSKSKKKKKKRIQKKATKLLEKPIFKNESWMTSAIENDFVIKEAKKSACAFKNGYKPTAEAKNDLDVAVENAVDLIRWKKIKTTKQNQKTNEWEQTTLQVEEID